jgi:hypothetical protein
MKIMIHSNPTAAYQFLGDDPVAEIKQIAKAESNEMRAILEGGKAVPKRLLMSAASFPESVIALGPKLPFQDPQLAKVIRSNTLIALYLLLTNYDELADQLEAVILRDGQYTLELLQQASRHQIALKHTLNYYERALLADPYFALMYSRLAPGRKILDHYQRESIEREPQTVADAFLQLSVAKSSESALPEPRLRACEKLLHEHPLYALIGSTRLKTLGIVIRAQEIKHLTPRYACAILQYGVVEGRESLLERLIINPLWLAHYAISTAEIGKKEIRELHAKMDAAVGDKTNKAFRLATKAFNHYLKTQ